MIKQQELTITFEWDGKTVHKETSGFEGKSCAEKTKFIEDALNGVNQKRRFKSEYNHKEVLVKDNRLKS